ncbi:hypothetical protein VL05_02250, partial [Bacillus stratosphericus]
LSIILSSIQYYFDIDKTNDNLLTDIKKIIELSPIADMSYKASSTNMKNVFMYLFRDHRIHQSEFTSLHFKPSRLEEINLFIDKNTKNK